MSVNKAYCYTILNRVHKDIKCMLYRLIHELYTIRLNNEYHFIYNVDNGGCVRGYDEFGDRLLYNYRNLSYVTYTFIFRNILGNKGWMCEVTNIKLPKNY